METQRNALPGVQFGNVIGQPRHFSLTMNSTYFNVFGVFPNFHLLMSHCAKKEVFH